MYLAVNQDRLEVNLPSDVEGHILVSQVAIYLDVLIANDQLPKTNILKINGKLPVLFSYLLVGKLRDFYDVIAIFIPQLNTYVVTVSNTQEYPVGSHVDSQTNVVEIIHDYPSFSESPFLIYWSEDILQAELNNTIKTTGDMIIVEVDKQLKNFPKPDVGEIIKVNGSCTVSAACNIADHLANWGKAYRAADHFAIAVNDPKLGAEDEKHDWYVIVISNNENYPLGTIIKVFNPLKSFCKVVICGPENTGKTCLREGLRWALQKVPDSPKSYVISGCPDGDGAWFSQTAQKNPELARSLKNQWKEKFTHEFALAKAKQIKAVKIPLLVFDVGGKMTEENQIIMAEATHSIILAKTKEQVKQWQKFCDSLNLPVIAIIISDYQATEDLITTAASPLFGIVHYLDRSQDATDRPIIKALAKLLSDLAKSAVLLQTP